MTIDLGTAFDGPGRGGAPGGWWLLDEPELHFGRDVLVPDLAAWRQERMPVIPDVLFFEIAPDWVCEVVSPTTEAIDRGRKRHIYARAGVRHLWMVNPRSRTLEVFRSEGGLWLEVATHLGGVRVRAEPFDAIELDMAPWFLPD